MDDMTALEHQLGTVLDRMGGQEPSFDAAAIASQASLVAPMGRSSVITRRVGAGRVPAPTEGGFSMFSAVKLVAAAAIVALFGAFLLLALPNRQEAPPAAPAAASSSPSATEWAIPSSTPHPTPEEWAGLEAAEPRPEGQPNHPLMNVDFQEPEGTGPFDWRVWDMAREGMDLTPFNMAIGPDWDVWEHEQGACGDKMLGEEVACIWQVGVPGVEFLPEGTEFIDFAAGPDGLIWGVTQQGLVAFDGRDWYVHDNAAGREDDANVAWDIGPDGSAWLLDEIWGGRFRLVHATRDGLEQIDVAEPSGASDPADLVYSLAVSSDGSVWVAGESAACWPSFGCQIPETLVAFVARFDGEAWVQEDLVGVGSPITGADVASGPDGSIWALVSTDDSAYLAALEGSEWSVFGVEEAVPGLESVSLGGGIFVGSDGTVWFDARLDEGNGLVSFDGETSSTHLWDGSDVRDAAAAPDGSVWLSMEDDGEGVGVYVLRH